MSDQPKKYIGLSISEEYVSRLEKRIAELEALARAVAHYWDGAATSYTEVGTIELDALVAAIQEGEV